MTQDPFFTLAGSTTWNACIGKQGDELNYLDGYIEAAFELADAVIKKNMFARRDTLVLPILYNARHAIELLLKYVINRLVDHDVIKNSHPRNHDIQSHYKLLVDSNLGDEMLRYNLAALAPFVTSLSRIDSDGQALRYHLDQDGKRSLENYSLANLEVIRVSVKELWGIIDAIKYRTGDFLDEHDYGTCTNRCSRRDLMAIATTMPPRSQWKTAKFDEAKASVKARFDLSNTQFSHALNAIQANREMNAVLGVETDLLSLTDDKAVAVIEQWRTLHPAPKPGQEPEIISGADITVEDFMKHNEAEEEVMKTLLDLLSDDDIADLEAVYYIGRDSGFPEYYEQRVAYIKQAAERNLREQLDHLLSKTNLLTCFQTGARRVGRLELAKRVAAL